jgi:hypothetical protein
MLHPAGKIDQDLINIGARGGRLTIHQAVPSEARVIRRRIMRLEHPLTPTVINGEVLYPVTTGFWLDPLYQPGAPAGPPEADRGDVDQLYPATIAGRTRVGGNAFA